MYYQISLNTSNNIKSKGLIERDNRDIVLNKLVGSIVPKALGSEYEIQKTTLGEPILLIDSKCTDYYLSISHTGEYTCINCADIRHKMTVDIQTFTSHLEPALINESLRGLNKLNCITEVRLKKLAIYWSIYESISKFLGIGLSLPMRWVEISKVYIKNHDYWVEIEGIDCIKICIRLHSKFVFALCCSKLENYIFTEQPHVKV